MNPASIKNSGKVVTFNMDIPQLRAPGRRFWVYLPPGYETSGLRYPVLYMHDGQNLFDPETSFCGDWGVGKILDGLCRRKKTRGAIVVGIDNGGEKRWDEYSPWTRADGTGRCKGAGYARFLVEDLKPLIDKRYRTLPGRETTGIAGSSLGGIISFYAAFKHPEVFSRAGVFSPSFWFARGAAERLVKNARLPDGLRVYMDVGTEEGDMKEAYLEDARAMAELMAAKKGVTLKFVVDEGGLHNEKDWARRFPAAFLWLFKDAEK
ncbi:MAG TPA: esterase [Elusimicrobia bacterium]|nr:MAG: hypothetical protein A2016_02890 [Elusimicrobia bacterium GWF2_62_30]HBA59866.1 esterase [Elusimicrobiota bacterium]